MENKETLGEVIDELKRKGYEADLSFEKNTYALYGEELDLRLDPDMVQVDEIDRIGNEERPAEAAVVYAISSHTGIKGVLVERPETPPL